MASSEVVECIPAGRSHHIHDKDRWMPTLHTYLLVMRYIQHVHTLFSHSQKQCSHYGGDHQYYCN